MVGEYAHVYEGVAPPVTVSVTVHDFPDRFEFWNCQRPLTDAQFGFVEVFGVPLAVNVRIVFGSTGVYPVTSVVTTHDTVTVNPVVAVPVTTFFTCRIG